MWPVEHFWYRPRRVQLAVPAFLSARPGSRPRSYPAVERLSSLLPMLAAGFPLAATPVVRAPAVLPTWRQRVRGLRSIPQPALSSQVESEGEPDRGRRWPAGVWRQSTVAFPVRERGPVQRRLRVVQPV